MLLAIYCVVQKKRVKIFHRSGFLYLCAVLRVLKTLCIRADLTGLDSISVQPPAES